MIAYIEHRETIAATGIATWDVWMPKGPSIAIKSEADTSSQELKREAHRLFSPLVDGTFMVEFYKPVIIPSETPMDEAIAILNRAHIETRRHTNSLTERMAENVKAVVKELDKMLQNGAPEAAIARLLEAANDLETLQTLRHNARARETIADHLAREVINELEKAAPDPRPS